MAACSRQFFRFRQGKGISNEASYLSVNNCVLAKDYHFAWSGDHEGGHQRSRLPPGVVGLLSGVAIGRMGAIVVGFGSLHVVGYRRSRRRAFVVVVGRVASGGDVVGESLVAVFGRFFVGIRSAIDEWCGVDGGHGSVDRSSTAKKKRNDGGGKGRETVEDECAGKNRELDEAMRMD